MSQPILSKKQLKKALSKKGSKETIKNVLATPYSNYFPLINEFDAKHLNCVLDKLPKLKPDKVQIPWSELKDIPKAERKIVRQRFHNKIEIDEDIKTNLVFGVNEVTKLLEKDDAATILITQDVDPIFMIRHVIDISVIKKVPVLIVPNLREQLKTNTGIESVTIGIKKHAHANSILHEVIEKVKNISLRYPVPKNHVHYYNPVSDLDSDDSLDETLQNLELQTDEKNIQSNQLYLYRKPNGARVFIPDSSNIITTMDVDQETMNVDQKDFISFGANNSSHSNSNMEFISFDGRPFAGINKLKSGDEKIHKVNKSGKKGKKNLENYKGLVVKRIRNNKNRKKKNAKNNLIVK